MVRSRGSLASCSSSVIQAPWGSIAVCSYFSSWRYFLERCTCLQEALSSLILYSTAVILSWWTSLRILCLPQGGSPILLCSWGRLMMLMFCSGLYYYALRGWSSFIILEAGSCLTFTSSCVIVILLSRCRLSSCYLPTKRATFLAKCVAFLVKCIACLISLVT